MESVKTARFFKPELNTAERQTMAEVLLATYSFVLTGVAFATWVFAWETRKTFKGGIFWNAWRIIATSLLPFMAHQMVMAYEAVYGSTVAAETVGESVEALGFFLILIGFFLFYKAWNPRVSASAG